MSYLNEMQEMASLVEDINSELQKNGISEVITLADISVTENSVSDVAKKTTKLSNAIINAIWPSIRSATVYHYTKRESAEAILNSGQFRLTSIGKRLSEDEIKTFCVSHNLDGYLASGSSGKAVYEEIAQDIFYASFTDVNIDQDREERMWARFGQCDGVRLRIEVTATNPDFRKMKYESHVGKPIALLNNISKIVSNRGRRFTLRGVSRLCAFYLPGSKYGIEEEIRMLYKIFDGYSPQPEKSREISYIAIPLGIMHECGYKMDVSEVHARVRPSMPDTFVFTQRDS